MGPWLQWGKYLFVGIGGLFFFIYGIEILQAAYRLNNPHEFIMYFFSSSLMILISAVGILYLLVHIYAHLKTRITKIYDR